VAKTSEPEGGVEIVEHMLGNEVPKNEEKEDVAWE